MRQTVVPPGSFMSRAVPAVLFAAAATAVVGGCGPKLPPADSGGPPVVTVAYPVVKKVTAFTDLTGTLKATETVSLRPRVSGYINRVNFTDGTEVKAGQVMVEIDPRPYEADLKKALGELENQQAQLKLHKADYERYATLRKTGAVTQEEFEKAAAQVDVSKANILSATGGVEQAKLNLEWTKVTAPIDGQADRVYLTAGNVVTGGQSQGTVLTTIVSQDPIYAYLNVDEARVLTYLRARAKRLESVNGLDPSATAALAVVGGPAIGVAELVPVEIQLKDEKGYPHKGFINFASNTLDPATGTLQLRAVLANPGPLRIFIPGLFVRARIPVDRPADAVLLPDSVVIADQAGKTVYVVGADNKIDARKVEVGPMADGLRVIVSGIDPQDKVVIRGMQRVTAGQPVDPKPGKIDVPAGK